jgi:hypothetical protein
MKLVAFCMCCVLILIAPGVMAQQPTDPIHSWDVMSQFQRGEKIEVQRKIGRRVYTGEIVSLSDTELEIDSNGKLLNFSRDEVRRVWYFPPPSRSKRIFDAMLVGAGLFLLAFVVAAAASSECSECVEEVVGASVGVGAGAGLIAYLKPSRKHRLIYIAP